MVWGFLGGERRFLGGVFGVQKVEEEDFGMVSFDLLFFGGVFLVFLGEDKRKCSLGMQFFGLVFTFV